jgi:tyrosyl-tRNA synthetase
VGTHTLIEILDKDKLPPATPEQVVHARTYAEQSYKILDKENTRVRFNAEWLSGLNFADLIRLASNFTLQQFLTRENFKLRWENGDAIYLHETFYALMQGYDAYALRADVQVGGTDQLFNILTAARKLMTFMGEKPNIGVIMGILPGTDGVIRMSKSLGNHIPTASPEDMDGKVMSIPDFAMGSYFRLVTRWDAQQIAGLESGLQEGQMHPRDVKMKLAREIVSIFHGDGAAAQAEDAFVRVFQRGDLPEEIAERSFQPGQTVLDILLSGGYEQQEQAGVCSPGGVRLDGET